jgi:hypothetical protein
MVVAPSQQPFGTEAGQRANNLRIELDARIQTLCPPPSNELLHYTSGAGFIGILEDGKLRASNLLGMNDAREVVEARDRLSDFLRTRSPLDSSERMLVEYLKARIGNIEKAEPSRAFVTAFTSAQDATTHWQGYAGSSGYALHFDGVSLAGAATRVGAYLACCQCEESMQTQLVTQFYEIGLRKLREAMHHGALPSTDAQNWFAEYSI